MLPLLLPEVRRRPAVFGLTSGWHQVLVLFWCILALIAACRVSVLYVRPSTRSGVWPLMAQEAWVATLPEETLWLLSSAYWWLEGQGCPAVRPLGALGVISIFGAVVLALTDIVVVPLIRDRPSVVRRLNRRFTWQSNSTPSWTCLGR